jgi:hypothetical protein
MTRRRPHPDQIELLSWEPTEPVTAFPAEMTRAATLPAMISKTSAALMKSSPLTRAEIALLMSEYLGETITENMLNAYASEARESHVISLPRFIALLHATGDKRGVQALIDQFKWTVIDSKYLPAIELAEIQEKQAEINKLADFKRRQLKAGGAWK